jgi:CheY-like chemotaxis protein
VARRDEEDAGGVVESDGLAGKRAALVDDNPIDARILRHHLEHAGMQVTVFERSAEALRGAEGGRFPDILIVAVEMPESERLALARSVRSDAAAQGLPILFCGSNKNANSAGNIEEVERSAFVPKPLRRSQLMAAVGQLLRDDAQTSAAAAERDAGLSGHVLVAEDNVTNQKVVQLLLTRAGCQVDIAANGREAVSALDLIDYDLVFMDCQMPVMDGFEATRLIREMERKRGKQRTPVIALTANALDGERERCLAAAMDDYLAKPVGKVDLEAKLKKWLPAKDSA